MQIITNSTGQIGFTHRLIPGRSLKRHAHGLRVAGIFQDFITTNASRQIARTVAKPVARTLYDGVNSAWPSWTAESD